MALIKKIELDNGVTVNYHRIVSFNKITNNSNIIEVASYTSKEKREEEKNGSTNVFINTIYLNKSYNKNELIEDTYNYLKELDMFKNAISE